MDIPFQVLKYVLTPENADPQKPRYEPCGLVITKRYAYGRGCRPVLYLSNDETKKLGIPKDELWRVVRFEVTDDGWISWLHEREWRCKGSFKMPTAIQAVLVRNTKDATRLTELHRMSPVSSSANQAQLYPDCYQSGTACPEVKEKGSFTGSTPHRQRRAASQIRPLEVAFYHLEK